MENELVPIRSCEIAGETKPMVSARELWTAFGSKQDFSNWFKNRLATYPSYTENVDYIRGTAASRGGRPAIEYFITVDFAYELSMVEEGKDSRKVRQFFIQFFKREKDRAVKTVDLHDPETLRGLLWDYSNRVTDLETKLIEQKPAVDGFNVLLRSTGEFNLTNSAKQLGIKPSELIAGLAEHRWIYKRGNSAWVPYQDKIQAGLMRLRTVTIEDPDDRLNPKSYGQAMITSKGLAKLADVFSHLVKNPRPRTLF